MTVRVHPLSVLVASIVAALAIWLLAWCSLPGPQPAPSTPVVVTAQPTTYVFTSPQPTGTSTRVPPEPILLTPTHAPTSTPLVEPTATGTPASTVTPDPSKMRQRG